METLEINTELMWRHYDRELWAQMLTIESSFDEPMLADYVQQDPGLVWA